MWREDGPTNGKCPWEMHDVWGWDVKKNEGVVLRENYFARHPESNKSVSYSCPIILHLHDMSFERRIGIQISIFRF